MPTPVLKVITEYCSVYVDDLNLNRLASEDMPLYARRMWGYLRPAIPLFNLPPDIQTYLMGTTEEPTFQEPVMAGYTYTFQTETAESTTIQLGEEYIGFELFCCRIRMTDDFGNIVMLPTSAVTYNAETGEVTFTASADAPIPAGTVFDMDFYTDGAFEKTLSGEIMNILGLCFRVVWLIRFDTDWLSMVPKVEDRSFTIQNIANQQKAADAKLTQAIAELSSQIRRFEQNLAFRAVCPQGSGLL